MELITELLNYLVPALFLPLATQLSKKILKVENGFFKAAIVGLLGFGAGYLMVWLNGLTLPTTDLVRLAFQYAFSGVLGWEGYNAIKTKIGGGTK